MEVSERLAIAKFLPDIELPSVQTGTLCPLRSPMGRTTVLVSVHSAECEGCQAYVDGLASSAGEFDCWDAQLVIVVPGAAEQMRARFGTVLADAARQISSSDNASAVIADRYGQIFEACHAGGGHGLPPPRQIEEWLKFLGTLCPE